VLVDANAVGERGFAEAPCEPCRIDERVAALVPQAAEIGRRVDLRANRVGIEEHRVLAVLALRPGGVREPLHLVGPRRDVDHSGRVPGGVDGTGIECLPDRLEVLGAEPLERLHLIRPARHPVLEPMRQRRLEEASVAPAGPPPAAVALEENNLLVRRGVKRRPQAGEAATDDRQVAGDVPVQGRQRRRRGRRVEPEDLLLGVGKRVAPHVAVLLAGQAAELRP
jgi:hypothetical protein